MIDKIVFVTIVLLLAAFSAWLAKKKGRKPSFWAVMGLIFGPFSAYYLFLAPVIASPLKPIGTLNERVKYFLEIGLLENKDGKSAEKVASDISIKYSKEWGNENYPPFDDVDLLKYGSIKMWWKDTEADVCEENQVYVDTLKEWGSISGGAFSPVNIVETWQGDEGPIEITFELNNKRYSLEPEFQDDYIDVDILKHINQLLGPSEYAFELLEPFDQSAVVLWLNREQKAALILRGWRFSW